MAINRQALFALLLIVLSVGYFAEALRLPTPFAQGEPGPAFFPMLLAALLFASASIALVGELRGGAALGTPDKITPKTLVLAAMTAGFVASFEPLGYVVATFAYSLAVAALFEAENGLRPGRIFLASLAVASGVTLTGWLFFVTLFDLYLPPGPF